MPPQGAGLCGVALGRGDDFAVVGPEPEAELPRLVLKQLEFGVGNRSGGAGGQILQPSLGRIALHRGDTTQAGRSGEVDFGCGDDLPIACGQVKFDTGSHGPNDEFSHDVSPFFFQYTLGWGKLQAPVEKNSPNARTKERIV